MIFQQQQQQNRQSPFDDDDDSRGGHFLSGMFHYNALSVFCFRSNTQVAIMRKWKEKIDNQKNRQKKNKSCYQNVVKLIHS